MKAILRGAEERTDGRFESKCLCPLNQQDGPQSAVLSELTSLTLDYFQ